MDARAEEFYHAQRDMRETYLGVIRELLGSPDLAGAAMAPLREKLQTVEGWLVHERSSGAPRPTDAETLLSWRGHIDGLLATLAQVKQQHAEAVTAEACGNGSAAGHHAEHAGDDPDEADDTGGSSMFRSLGAADEEEDEAPYGGGGGGGGSSMFSTLKRANTDARAAAPAKGGRGSVADPSLEQRLRNIMWAHGDAAAPRPRCVELLLEHVRGWRRQLVTTRLKPPPAAPRRAPQFPRGCTSAAPLGESPSRPSIAQTSSPCGTPPTRGASCSANPAPCECPSPRRLASRGVCRLRFPGAAARRRGSRPRGSTATPCPESP